LRRLGRFAPVLVFAASFALSCYSIYHNRQFGYLGGIGEEYFDTGLTWAYPDELLSLRRPDRIPDNVFRPPGYSFFIATAVTVWAQLSGVTPEVLGAAEGPDRRQLLYDAFAAVYYAQALLVALAAMFMMLALRRFIRPGNALMAALLYGCCPYMISMVGYCSYAAVHSSLVVIACYAMLVASDPGRRRWAVALTAGVLWGLATLTRPMSLILPLFALLLFWLRCRPAWRPVLPRLVFLVLGMFLVIAPYTARNYSMTGHVVPVNAQGKTAFWAGTEHRLERNPNHFRWWKVWFPDGKAVYTEVTGAKKFSFQVYVAHAIELEQAYTRRALQNLERKPQVYVHNVVEDMISYSVDINSVFIKLFQQHQVPYAKLEIKPWLTVGNPQDFHPHTATRVFEILFWTLTGFAFLGAIVAACRRQGELLAPGLVWFCFCLAHALTYLDFNYYYSKVPFVFLFAGYFVDAAARVSIPLPFTGRRLRGDVALNALLAAVSAWLVYAVLVARG
jgi:hypothetical protein